MNATGGLVSRRRVVAAAASAAALPGVVRAATRSTTYIVVGGGSAGCVLARRLSDDPARSVLLIEAGGARQPPEVDIPARWLALSDTDLNWRFKTTPQSFADGRVLPLARGRTLGGSSVINALVHHRGVSGDYDRWETLGARGWSAPRMQALFRRSETWLGMSDPRRGKDGPILVHPIDQPSLAAMRFLEGARGCGHRVRDDLNADPGAGAATNQIAFDGRRRMSTWRAYLAPVVDRSNLAIVTDAQATGLIVERGRCTGVRYLKDGAPREAFAEGEVIVCAGAIQSPQLLMLSGVGPADALARHGIRIVADAPGVGENLHEHLLYAAASIETREAFAPSRLMGTDAVLYARSTHASDARDLMFNFGAAAAFAGMVPGCRISFADLKPKSRGRLALADADPLHPPMIDPAVLSDPDDVRVSLDGLRMARDILNGPAFADVRVRELSPGPSTLAPDALRAHLRRTGVLFGHSVGTCRMGEDAGAVVDPELRVRGVAGLRVADASVIPEIPSAPTNATVIALAERAAELIAEAAR